MMGYTGIGVPFRSPPPPQQPAIPLSLLRILCQRHDTEWHNMAIRRLKCVLSLMRVVC